jgi:hypothetical protein
MKEKMAKHQQKDSENLENKFENFDNDVFLRLFEFNTSVLTLLDPYSGKIINANPAAAKFYKN